MVLASLDLLGLCGQGAIMLILPTVLVLLLCTGDQRTEGGGNCNTLALPERLLMGTRLRGACLALDNVM